MKSHTEQIILASASPRRAQVLRDAGIPFEMRASDVDETMLAGETAEVMVARLAEEKARFVAARWKSEQSRLLSDHALIVGADTCVECSGKIFGKPHDAANAGEMLTALSGRVHRVLTGISVIRIPEDTVKCAIEVSTVTFAKMDDAEIDAYIASGEPFDKAGAYAIQGQAGRYITRIEGCYFNVVGLPLSRLYRLLRSMGWNPIENVMPKKTRRPQGRLDIRNSRF